MRRRAAGRGNPLRVTVNNRRCHRYAVCQAEAPEVFALGADGRLHYRSRPVPGQHDQVRMAARYCPMQAITVDERHG